MQYKIISFVEDCEVVAIKVLNQCSLAGLLVESGFGRTTVFVLYLLLNSQIGGNYWFTRYMRVGL